MRQAAARRTDAGELDGGSPAAVDLRQVSVHYPGSSNPALAELSLRIDRGETVALLGPSGSGKSTALKAIAGFEVPSTGQVFLSGNDVTTKPPSRRGIGVVVQAYALFPHLRVADNVGYGLRARRLPKAEVRARVAEMLDMVGMSAFARKLPRELSGGQQQRVAIARALAIRPEVLLLDEPLSALDTRLRQEMLQELINLRRELPDIATVYVTHDQSEALALADRIGIMRDGRLVDLGTAEELYHRPRHAFTATFLGGANLLPGVVEPAEDEQNGRLVRLDSGARIRALAHGPLRADAPVSVAVRPHALRPSEAGLLEGTVLSTQWRGAGHRVRVGLTASEQTVTVDLAPFLEVPEVGATVRLDVVAGEAAIVPRAGADR